MPQNKGGKVFSFSAFKTKGVVKEVTDQQDAGEGVSKQSKDATFDSVIKDLGKQGIPIAEAIKRTKDLTSLQVQGGFNQDHFREWLGDLRLETIKDLANRVMKLNVHEIQKRPAYSRAVFMAFTESVRARVKAVAKEKRI